MSFSELLEAALAGTSRQDPPAVVPTVDTSAENRLLRGASYEGLRRLAGRPLERAVVRTPLASAEAETQPEVPPPAASRLFEILDLRPELLPEWLRLVVERGLRAPHLSLPDLLENARTADDDIRDLIVAAGGRRLPWLARLNPDWQFAAWPDPDEGFASAGRDDRPRALRRIRHQNAARGRALLLNAWSAERGESRASLLDALSTGLSADDEPLLWSAISDSRKEVRETALHLIRRIPGSGFSVRWTERARQVFTVDSGSPQAPRLHINEPTAADSAWLADGLDPLPPKGIGMAAWLLQQVLAFTPPSIWPTSMIAAIRHTDWYGPLLAGLGQAADAYADDDWCGELLVLRARTKEALPLDAPALFAALQPHQAESVLRRLIELGPAAIAGLPDARSDPWSEDFSRFLVLRLPRLIARWQYSALPLLQAAHFRLEPRVLPELEGLLEAELQLQLGWARPSLDRLAETLEYRHAMRTELG